MHEEDINLHSSRSNPIISLQLDRVNHGMNRS
jgi:hypothetical protein